MAEAFGLLASARPVLPGFGETVLAPIPLTEIRAYLDLFGTDDPEAFVRLIRAADQTYLARHADRRRAAADNSEAAARGGSAAATSRAP